MAVHDAIRRAVDGRRIARESHQAAIEREADEITRLHDCAGGMIPADETHTIPPPEGPPDDHP